MLLLLLLFFYTSFFHIGTVVPVNVTVRLPDQRWREDLSNTTSELFINLSRKLEIGVSIYLMTIILANSSIFNLPWFCH